jgi:hypothetical protein
VGRPAASGSAAFEGLLEGSSAEAPPQQSWPVGWSEVVAVFGRVSIFVLMDPTPLGSSPAEFPTGQPRTQLLDIRRQIP